MLLFNVVLPAACFVLARRFAADPQSRQWATYSWMTGALILLISLPVGTFVLPFAYKAGFPVVDGLIQRFVIFIGWAWLALTALRLFLQERKASVEEASTRIAITNVKAD